MRDLNIEEKIAQMLLIEIQGEGLTEETKDIIKKCKVGGVVLYRRNYNNYNQMIELVNGIKEANKENEIPIFVSVDQEGGRVNRLPYEIKNLKSAGKIASKNDVELLKKSANILARTLNDLGINMNYAPVLDIQRFGDGHAIGDRCYGNNKQDVYKYGIEVANEMKKQEVIPVVKHFPGHGATTKDSHFSLPIVKESIKELEENDIKPFENAIENGIDAIMVGHIVVKDLDKRYPASLSKKVIKNYLIDKYKFKGLIITDDLKMLAIRLRYTRRKAIRLAINAGNDMVMIGCKYTEIKKLIKDLAKDVKRNRIDEKQLDKSIEKIIEMKKKYNINDKQIQGVDIEKINQEVEEINNKVVD